MSSALVIHYSKSGHTARIAHLVADGLSAERFTLRTRRYRLPYFGYLRAGKDSLSGNLPPLEAVPDIAGYDIVALGGPVWTSYPATPLRAWLANAPVLPERFGLFLTSGDHSPPEKAYDMVRQITGRDPLATLCIANTSEDDPATAGRIDAFCKRLRGD